MFYLSSIYFHAFYYDVFQKKLHYTLVDFIYSSNQRHVIDCSYTVPQLRGPALTQEKHEKRDNEREK